MKFTRSILNEIVPLEGISNQEICQALNKIGLEVESFKEIKAPKNVVVGKVLECQKHPNADKLSITKVAVSGKEGAYKTKQIVCGASNVREGQNVAVALEGAVLPQVKIKKTKIREVESFGMLCSSLELGFPKINEGILELDDSLGELEIGKDLSQYPLFNDAVFEIAITPNRGDCMNLLGIAREIKVAFGLQNPKLKSPKVSENAPGIGRILQIIQSDNKKESSLAYKAMEVNPITLSCKHLLFLAYNDLLLEDWLKNVLMLGMLHTGVLLNAYPQSFCQLSKENTKAVLQIKKDELGFESVFNQDKKLAILGVDNYIDQKVPNYQDKEFVVFEASYIPPQIIAQKVLENKISKESRILQRSTRGSNPNLSLGLDFVSDLLLENPNSILYNDTHEFVENKPKEPIEIEIPLMLKNIGITLDKTQIINILKALECQIKISNNNTSLMVTPPDFRHDILTHQDITEEIIRFVGIDNVPNAPLGFLQHNQTNVAKNTYHFYRKLSLKAVGVGFNEVIHFVFSEKEKLKKYGFETLKESLDLLNPITQELNTLRSSLLLGLVQAAQRNTNNGFKAISLMEMGSVYNKERQEIFKLAFLQSGLIVGEFYPYPKGHKGDFFTFADRVSRVIGEFSLEPIKNPLAFFHPNQCANILKKGKKIGILATLHPKVTQEFDLEETFVCEVNLEALGECQFCVEMHSKFPKVTRDLSIVVKKEIPYYQIQKTLISLKIPNVIKFYPLDVYEDEKLQDKISLTLRFELQSSEKTLEEKDITQAIEIAFKALQENYEADLR